MSSRPPQLSPRRLLATLLLPLVGYLLIHALVGSPARALAYSEAIPTGWLVVVGVARRRLDRPALASAATVAVALAAYALTGGNPLAIELRRGAVTGLIGVAALASVAVGRPLLLLVAERTARLNPEHRPAIEARLAQPQRRRALAVLTAIVGLTFVLDGATQTILALAVSPDTFSVDSTAVRVVVLGSGIVIAVWYFNRRREQLRNGPL